MKFSIVSLIAFAALFSHALAAPEPIAAPDTLAARDPNPQIIISKCESPAFFTSSSALLKMVIARWRKECEHSIVMTQKKRLPLTSTFALAQGKCKPISFDCHANTQIILVRSSWDGLLQEIVSSSLTFFRLRL